MVQLGVLLSDIPSYREVWQDTATYFPPDDPAALAQAWSRLLDDPAQASALARRARTRAQTRYSPDRMRAAYESLYACVATPPAAPSKRPSGSSA